MRPVRFSMILIAGMVRIAGRLACIGAFLVLAGEVGEANAAAEILRVRHWTAPDHTRIVLDLSEPSPYEVRRVSNPERLAINVAGATFMASPGVHVNDGLLLKIRGNVGRGRAQVVLDLDRAAEFRHFPLRAADGRPDRIVVDVFRGRNGSGATSSPGDRAVMDVSGPADPAPNQTFTVVFDPGHGGLDPGAIRAGIREKDVVLKVAQIAAKLLNQVPGYRAELTRKGDYFIGLRRRVQLAQEHGGDLFISVHANTNQRHSTTGMEVYFLSLQGATDREAEELADKENAADLVGLAPNERQDDEVLSILMDLRMTRVLQHSSRLADCILTASEANGAVKTGKAKQARFQVLQTLAMPAALVELAYLSNGQDRKLMTSPKGQQELAKAIVAGVMRYRDGARAVAMLGPEQIWTCRHQVRSGDTLWDLAKKHGTTIGEIRQKNNLASVQIHIGQMLRLPPVE